ncbi:MAG: hypothetical protein ACI9KE_002861 [Polyangiales bacterium]
MKNTSFDQLLDDLLSSHLGPDKTEGIGLLWKLGGFTELLIDLHRRAPHVLVALAREAAREPQSDERFARFLKAWSEPSEKERTSAMAVAGFAPPVGTLFEILDALEPPMPEPYLARIADWLDRAESLERGFLAAPTTALRDVVASLRAHLAVTSPIEVDPEARRQAEETLGSVLPSEVVWLLHGVGHTLHKPIELLGEIESFYEGMETADWRVETGFRHIPILARGEEPRSYLCCSHSSVPTQYQVFDLKKGLDPKGTTELSTAMHDFWTDVRWGKEVPDAAAELFGVSESPAPDSQVHHPKFGAGEVLEDKGDRVIVRFASGDERTLLKRFVGL